VDGTLPGGAWLWLVLDWHGVRTGRPVVTGLSGTAPPGRFRKAPTAQAKHQGTNASVTPNTVPAELPPAR
jgi:hypothetical protein